MNSIALGQFYPSSSVMHRLDPRMKIILAIAYMVVSFLCQNVFSFVLLLCSAIVLVLISRIPLKIVLRSVKAIMFIMLHLMGLHILELDIQIMDFGTQREQYIHCIH